jgi:hypothetical protein
MGDVAALGKYTHCRCKAWRDDSATEAARRIIEFSNKKIREPGAVRRCAAD